MADFSLYLGDCLKILAELPDASVDAVVTDPPAGIACAGNAWKQVADACVRVLKPGGHAIFWALPHTTEDDAGIEARENLLQYLIRLITPPGGTVLDPFMGSGSTGKAAMREGVRFIGIEQDPDYYAIAESRIRDAADQGR